MDITNVYTPTEKEVAELQKYVKDEYYKDLLIFCVEPKSWDDIRKLKVKQSKLFQILKDLKIIHGLGFNNDTKKYFTSDYAKSYL